MALLKRSLSLQTTIAIVVGGVIGSGIFMKLAERHTAFFLGATLYTDIVDYQKGTAPIVNALLGILITCIGVPVYFLSKKR